MVSFNEGHAATGKARLIIERRRKKRRDELTRTSSSLSNKKNLSCLDSESSLLSVKLDDVAVGFVEA